MFPANGHYYQVVRVEGGITWPEAKEAAENISLNGVSRHLATITSREENDWVVENTDFGSGQLWIGGFQTTPNGGPESDWQWVTGESWSYTNWNEGEPNDAGYDEIYLMFDGGGGTWNDDLSNALEGYVVEVPLQDAPTSSLAVRTAVGEVFPANGHYYQVVRVEGGITWPEAKEAAENMAFKGVTGHLATVSSREENDWVVENTDFGSGQWWIGGFQTTPNGGPESDWHWVTGEPWSYTNWDEGEPNDSGDGEIFLMFKGRDGVWNDEHPMTALDGYVVEVPLQDAPIASPPVALVNPAQDPLLECMVELLGQERAEEIRVTGSEPTAKPESTDGQGWTA